MVRFFGPSCVDRLKRPPEQQTQTCNRTSSLATSATSTDGCFIPLLCLIVHCADYVTALVSYSGLLSPILKTVFYYK